MIGAQDKAVSQIAGLDEASDAVASNLYVIGMHHLSLAVYGDTLAEVEDRAGRARSRLADSGAVVVEERLGLEPAFWSQLPGNDGWRARPGAINSRNFAGFSSLDNFPAGGGWGHWGRPIARFRTDGGTAYDYLPHVADVAMTIIFGPIGSGKTALLMFLLAMFEQAMLARNAISGTRGSVVFFDKDRGGELLVRASEGTYLELRRGEASGMSPLRGLRTTRADADFLRGWIIALIQSDGKGTLTPDDEKRLERAIARQLNMPVELRSLAGLREFLGHSDPLGCGPRLEKWCRGNALGWAFDGERDEVRIDENITGFDMTQLLEHDEVCAPAGAYLLYRVTQILDGRRVVLSIDEFRFYLKNAQFAAVVDNLLLTVRKSNGAVFLALQMPEHILESPLGPSIVTQCQTKIIYPSPTADRDVYINGLKCTEGEDRAVREDMLIGKRRFLLKREKGSVICEFDLGDMREYIAVLSGRANTVRFAENLRRQFGDDPAAGFLHLCSATTKPPTEREEAMRALWFALALVGAGLALAPRADAQVPVIDSANLAQNLRTATQAVIEVEQLKNQLQQLEETYQMFTNPTNVLGMASGLENQAIENPMPAANAVAGLLGGQTAPSGAAATYFNDNHVYTPTDGSPESTQLNANAQGIANIEGIAATRPLGDPSALGRAARP